VRLRVLVVHADDGERLVCDLEDRKVSAFQWVCLKVQKNGQSCISGEVPKPAFGASKTQKQSDRNTVKNHSPKAADRGLRRRFQRLFDQFRYGWKGIVNFSRVDSDSVDGKESRSHFRTSSDGHFVNVSEDDMDMSRSRSMIDDEWR
jgi:hypothetical protein